MKYKVEIIKDRKILGVYYEDGTHPNQAIRKTIKKINNYNLFVDDKNKIIMIIRNRKSSWIYSISYVDGDYYVYPIGEN